jgi:hypothetical protein
MRIGDNRGGKMIGRVMDKQEIRIIGFERKSPAVFLAKINCGGVPYMFEINVKDDGAIRSLRFSDLPKPVEECFYRSSASRDFAKYFWLFFDGEDLRFPINCHERE